MNTIARVSIGLCLVAVLSSFAPQQPARTVQLLDRDWKFTRGDVPGAQQADFDDSAWETVCVPHDWAIGHPFDMTIDIQVTQTVEDGETKEVLRTGRTGALPMFGVGWYRREITLPESETPKRVWLEFDGAMNHAQVYMNGTLVMRWAYGYTSFCVEVTDRVRRGGKNTLAVRLDNPEFSSRWYSGAGLYRNVRLVETNPLRIENWGVTVTTPQITDKKGVANVRTLLDGAAAATKIVTEIYDDKGVKVASNTLKAKPGQGEFNQSLAVPSPRRWDITSPVLYCARTEVYAGETLCDSQDTYFGFRTIGFDADKGFSLNGRRVKLQGVCLHHDLGPLGAAVNVRATQRYLELMQEMGCNAIRTSHNPPSPEFLDLCDRMGLLVIDEAFDEWKSGKLANGYSLDFDEFHERDLISMIHRDRNHPSVILWSIGNEIREQSQAEGYLVARQLARICRREDPTRLVTAGFNSHHKAIENGLAREIDVVGFNYKPHDYRNYHEKFPDMILLGSETASTVSTRGEYKFPVQEFKHPWYDDYQLSSYDLDFVRWGSTPDVEFAAQQDNPFSLGEFVWTGIDYLGEPTPYNEGTPARSSYFGMVDLAGLKKDRFYLYKSHWSSQPVLHLLPHWNFPERVGQVVPVYCYTNYPKAELFVNGKSMGTRQFDASQKYDRYRLRWDDVVYQPGDIRVVAYDQSGVKQAEQTIRTAGRAATIRLTPDRDVIAAGGKDLSFITVDVLDKDGNPVPRAAEMLFFEVEGAGKLKALCNGDPCDQSSFASSYMRLFNGKLVAVVESGRDGGEIRLKAYGGWLTPAQTVLTVK